MLRRKNIATTISLIFVILLVVTVLTLGFIPDLRISNYLFGMQKSLTLEAIIK